MAMNVCVLRSGGEYRPGHVRWLAKQVPDLHCLSDVEVEGVPTIPLKHDWPGWWSKLELFSPDIEQDLLYFDLDTVVLKMPEVNPSQSLMLRDFYQPKRPGSGFMYIRHEDKSRVWDAWIKNPDTKYKPTRLHHGDQGFLWDHFHCGRWQDEYRGLVQSYKVDVRNGKPTANVVCFHGNPRPWQVKADWIPRL